MAVPVALAGPRPRFYDSHVHTELSQPRMPCQPLAGLTPARLVEWTWIGTAWLRGHDRKIDLLHSVEHPEKWDPQFRILMSHAGQAQVANMGRSDAMSTDLLDVARDLDLITTVYKICYKL